MGYRKCFWEKATLVHTHKAFSVALLFTCPPLKWELITYIVLLWKSALDNPSFCVLVSCCLLISLPAGLKRLSLAPHSLFFVTNHHIMLWNRTWKTWWEKQVKLPLWTLTDPTKMKGELFLLFVKPWLAICLGHCQLLIMFLLKHRVVEFASRSDMKNAISKLDGTELNGRKLKIFEDSRRWVVSTVLGRPFLKAAPSKFVFSWPQDV